MNSSDHSIHNICIAAIKRKTIKPYDFKWTTFYTEKIVLSQLYDDWNFATDVHGLVVCSTVIDHNNFSILTTQKIVTILDGVLTIRDMNGANDKLYGNFKGYKNEPFTFGKLALRNGTEFKYFIETGRASMVMISGIRTILGMLSTKS